MQCLLRCIGIGIFLLSQLVVSSAVQADTYQAIREYRKQIGNNPAGPTVYPSFAAAAKAAWDAYSVPPFMPGATKINWWTNKLNPRCQTKEEPAYVSQNDYVEVMSTILFNGATQCNTTYNTAVIFNTCPSGGNLVVNQCYNASSCPSGLWRNPVTGKCGLYPVNFGSCETCPTTDKGNLVNSAIGNKHQAEVLYQGAGAFPLDLRIQYNSMDSSRLGRWGTQWQSNWDRSIGMGQGPASYIVGLYRPDGKVYFFWLSGGAWIANAAIPGKLERFTNASGIVTGWKYTSKQDEAELYDAAGKLLSITDRAGRTQTLTYDIADRLIRVTDHYGRPLNFGYDSASRIVTSTDPNGGIIQYAYNASNNLATVTFPGSVVRTYHYENTSFPNALTGITDERGQRFANFSYDTQGRAIQSEHAGGADRHQFAFGTNSTVVTDPLGTQRSYNFQIVQGFYRISSETQPAGSGHGAGSRSYTYDANANLATRTDFLGNQTRYTYELARNLETSRVEAYGAPQARTTTTSWHATFRLPLQVAEPLRITSYTYDAQGNMLTRTLQATNDANGSQGFAATPVGTPRTWTWTYSSPGQMLTADGPRTDVSDLTTYTYYPANDPDLGRRGNLASTTNALSQITNITGYDAHGRPLTITDPNGLTTTLAYDARGRLAARSADGETTSYQYDGVGQLTRVTLPDGSYLAYTYDAAQRLAGVADNLGNSIAYTLDAMGNRTREEVRDPASQLTQLRQRVFDALSRLAQDIGAASQTTAYAYDANGNVTSVTDPLSHATTSAYDALNRLIRTTDPTGGQINYAYNGQDQLTQVTDPRNLATTYAVDGLGNVTTQVSPDTGTTQSVYDAAGNLTSRSDAKGQSTTYQYDALNRVTLVTHADGSQVRTTYDLGTNGIGRVRLIEELTGGNVTASIQYGYDALGRVTSEARALAGVVHTTTYGYANGRLASVTYPSGRRIDYTHDGLGRISQIQLTDNGQVKVLASAIQYQPFGGVKSFMNGANQTITRSFDQDGRIASYSLGGQTWLVGYDAASRITFQTDAGNAANTASYGYDAADRLTGAVLPATTLGYAYDATGNRTSQTVGGTTRTYTTAPTSNRLTAIDSGPPKSYTFDANGAITGDGQSSFGYDARGRMTSAVTAAGTTQYRVNALGQRTRKTNATEDILYLYDRNGRLLAEASPAGQIQREYIYLYDTLIGVVR